MNHRPWFRILPLFLALAIVPVLLAACGGGSSAASPPPTTKSDGTITYHLKADGMKFDTARMSMPANTRVTIVFKNDEAPMHNFALYKARFDANAIFRGELISNKTIEYTFTTPAQPGTYAFQCDLHPEMYGDFIVT